MDDDQQQQLQQLQLQRLPSYDAIILSGGGAATITFVGALRYLEHIGCLHKAGTLVGTSAGAILALLVSLGMGSHDVRAWLMENLGSGDLSSLDPERIFEFAERLGVDDGCRMLGCMRRTLQSRGVPCASGDGDPTFLELAKHTGKNLVVCAANLTLVRHEFFCVDTTPDVSVLLAVRMSFGIPLLFTPIFHRGCCYVDGGLFDNCPVDYLHRQDAPKCGSALALSISYTPQKADDNDNVTATTVGSGDGGNVRGPAMGVAAYVRMLLRAMFVKANAAVPCRADDPRMTVVDITPPDDAMRTMWNAFSFDEFAFRLDKTFVDHHMQHGYTALRNAFEQSDIK
jgi:predicted acylesterase/phospholipase RssA